MLHDHDYNHNHAFLSVHFQVSSRSSCCTTTSTTRTLLSVRHSRQTLIFLLCSQVTKAASSLFLTFLLSSSSLFPIFELVWSTQLTATSLSSTVSLPPPLSSSVLSCAVLSCFLTYFLFRPVLSCPVLSSHLFPVLCCPTRRIHNIPATSRDSSIRENTDSIYRRRQRLAKNHWHSRCSCRASWSRRQIRQVCATAEAEDECF